MFISASVKNISSDGTVGRYGGYILITGQSAGDWALILKGKQQKTKLRQHRQRGVLHSLSFSLCAICFFVIFTIAPKKILGIHKNITTDTSCLHSDTYEQPSATKKNQKKSTNKNNQHRQTNNEQSCRFLPLTGTNVQL